LNKKIDKQIAGVYNYLPICFYFTALEGKMHKIDLSEMDRDELMALQADIKIRMLDFRPYRIKERVTQCGKRDCWCYEGPDGHGPYLYVAYRDAGRTRQVGLGPKLTEEEMIDEMPAMPLVTDYLKIPDRQFQKMTHADTIEWLHYTLSEAEFFERHGLYPRDDTFGRPLKFWGSRADYEAYEWDHREALERSSIQYNEWVGWGVSTLKGIGILRALERRGYYQKT